MTEVVKGFKKKHIERIIRFKVKEWLKTIDNENLKKVIQDNYILTGGAIASMLQGQEPNDFDIYFKTTDSCLQVANYYIAKVKTDKSEVGTEIKAKEVDGHIKILVKSAGIIEGDNLDGYKYFETLTKKELDEYFDSKSKSKGKYDIKLITTNAISLNDQIQLVLRFCGNPEEIHKNYDFIHATNYFTEETGLVLNQPALESIITKELKYVGSVYPVCSMFRTRKFIKRGWTINAGEMLKIAFDISKLNLSDTLTLREQLIGVDFAYFCQVLDLLNNKESIDRTYLFEVLTKVFDEDDSMNGDVDYQLDNFEETV